MMIKEYKGVVDRTGWGPGPWDIEPDKIQWKDENTELPCMAIRSRMGNWCGYVGVAQGHPAYAIHYDGCTIEAAKAHMEHFRKHMKNWQDAPPYPEKPIVNQAVNYINVHGGLTYSDFCQHGPEGESICHVPDEGEPDNIYWFGFDCGHCYDYSPGLKSKLREIKNLDPDGYDYEASRNIPDHEEVYRTLDYVKSECRKLAKQLAEMK